MVELEVKNLKGFKEKVLGLLFKNKAVPVLIKTRFGIHTFGLKFPIDILVLDKTTKVVKIIKDVKPNRIVLWNPVYNLILELPEGEIERNGIKLEEKIRMNFV